MAMDGIQTTNPGRTRRAAVGIFLVCLVVYHANGRPQPEVDCITGPYVAWSLLRHGSLDLRGCPDLERYVGTEVRELPDGRWVSARPPGSALAALPFVAPFTLGRSTPLSLVNMVHLGKLTAAVSVAGAAAFFFLICRRLAPGAAWPATILFGLGTCLWSVASQALWMHGPATFWLTLALYLLLPTPAPLRPGRAGLAGLALGLAIVTRPTTAFFGLASGLALLVRRRWAAAFALGFGAVPPVLGFCLVNLHLFGSPFLGGYVTDNWTEHPPLWLGVTGLLIAPSRGVLVYSPALMLLPLGLFLLGRRPVETEKESRAVLLFWSAAAAATVVFFARWHDWFGGWCYGPRFLCETMPIGCLLFALAYSALAAVWQKRLALTLVAWSVGIHFLGVAGRGGFADWYLRHNFADQGRAMFTWRDTQVEAHARAVLRKVGAVFGNKR
jgi:hypothetical protein